MAGTYEAVGSVFKFCQLMQFLEVMHPMFGYTKGNVLIPFLQVTVIYLYLYLVISVHVITLTGFSLFAPNINNYK